MKILVTGASGFLGSNLCEKLNRLNHNTVALSSKNCDLTKENSLLNFNQEKYDQIYHLAAWTQAGDFCLYHPGEQWIINQQINTNVLTWWKEYQPQAKLICIGTSCSYDPNLELKEENYLIGTPIESLYTYAMTKRMLQIGLQSLHKQFNLNYLTVIPSTLYGPGYHTDDRQMHFIFDLIRKILRGNNQGEIVTLWGDGYQKRELVYLDDFVNILIRVANTHKNTLLNIGAGEEYTIREFAQLICNKVNYDFNLIQFDSSKYVGAKSKMLDVTKLHNSFPSLKQTNLQEGLEKTIDWFQDCFLKPNELKLDQV